MSVFSGESNADPGDGCALVRLSVLFANGNLVEPIATTSWCGPRASRGCASTDRRLCCSFNDPAPAASIARAGSLRTSDASATIGSLAKRQGSDFVTIRVFPSRRAARAARGQGDADQLRTAATLATPGQCQLDISPEKSRTKH